MGPATTHSSSRHQRRPWYVKYRKLRRWPKQIVFWFAVLIGVGNSVLVFLLRGWPYLSLALIAVIFIIRVLYVNDNKGFGKSLDGRSDVYLNSFERIVLVVVILMLFTVSTYRLML